jgi:hypothetical protein
VLQTFSIEHSLAALTVKPFITVKRSDDRKTTLIPIHLEPEWPLSGLTDRSSVGVRNEVLENARRRRPFLIISTCSKLTRYIAYLQTSISAWSNWPPACHIRSETSCNQARKIISSFITCYCQFIYFIYYERSQEIPIISSTALRTNATDSC